MEEVIVGRFCEKKRGMVMVMEEGYVRWLIIWEARCCGLWEVLLMGAMEEDERVWLGMSVYYGCGVQEVILLVIKV